MSLRSTRRDLYRAARVLGDVDAAAHGPDALARRLVRKAVWRTVGRVLRKASR